MDVAWSRARPDEKYLIHGFRKFTLGDRYLPEGLLPLREFVRFANIISLTHYFLHTKRHAYACLFISYNSYD